ncbi:FxsA family protein [Gordonia sp. NPDC003429]
MRFPYALVYLVLEIAVFVALVMTLGIAWAVLITILATFFGFLMLRWQGRKVFAELRKASRNEVDARGPLVDTAVVGASSVLLIVPGLVSTVLGTLLLIPGVRTAVRPLVVAMGTRTMMKSMDRAGLYATGLYRDRTVIDGTVIDGDTVATSFTDPGDARGSATPQLPRGH